MSRKDYDAPMHTAEHILNRIVSADHAGGVLRLRFTVSPPPET